jgi:hypothetical protein
MPITTYDIECAISDVTRRKHDDMQQFLHMIDTYGLTEVALWLRNVEKDLSVPSPGLISDVRRG